MALEDFTTYTEVDPNSHIGLVGTDHIDFDAWDNEDAYCYRDLGVDHFGDFTHKIDINPVTPGDNAHATPWMVSNDIDDVNGLRAASKTFINIHLIAKAGTAVWFRIHEEYLGVVYTDHYDAADNTWYYLLIKKAGTAFNLGIYSTAELRDAGDATDGDLDNLALTLHADHKFRYVFACNTWNISESIHMDVDIDNLDLQEGEEVTAVVTVGTVASATRILEIDRDSTVITGILATAVRVKEAPRSAAVIVGMVASATRDIVAERTASVITGLVATATRVANFFESAAVIVGLKVAEAIDIGEPAIVRTTSIVDNNTSINRGNPANASGIITSIEIYASAAYPLVGCKVGTFYTTNGNTLKCRDVEDIGNVSGGSKQTFSGLSLAVVAGDYIGIYYSTGGVYVAYTGGSGEWYITGDHCIIDDETTYTLDSGGDSILSLYGTGGVIFASRLAELSRTPAVQVGEVASATRALIIERISSVVVGVVATATKVGENIVNAVVQIGLVASASRVTEISRDAITSVGLLVAAVGYRGASVLAAVTIGIVATASKTLVITRTASVIIGKVATAFGFKGAAITAAVIVGVETTATRTLDISRTASTIVGKAVTATVISVLLIGRSLLIRVTTSPYRSIVVATSQYRLVRVATALYRKIKVFTLGR